MGRCQILLKNEISIFKKLVSRRKHEVLQNFLVNGCSDVGFQKNNGPTPADDIASQIITDCGNLTLDFKQLGLWASPPFLQTLGPWFPNEILYLLSSEKRTLDYWAIIQFFFSLVQVRRLWRQLLPNSLTRLCVVALDILTPASVHFLWSSPNFLNLFCLTILIRL